MIGNPLSSLPPGVIQQLLSQLMQQQTAGGSLGLSPGGLGAAMTGGVGGGGIPVRPPEPMAVAGAQGGAGGGGSQGNVIYAPPTPQTQPKPPSPKAQASTASDTWSQDFIHMVGRSTGQYVDPNQLGLTSRADANTWLTQWGFPSLSDTSGTGGLY